MAASSLASLFFASYVLDMGLGNRQAGNVTGCKKPRNNPKRPFTLTTGGGKGQGCRRELLDNITLLQKDLWSELHSHQQRPFPLRRGGDALCSGWAGAPSCVPELGEKDSSVGTTGTPARQRTQVYVRHRHRIKQNVWVPTEHHSSDQDLGRAHAQREDRGISLTKTPEKLATALL